MIKLDEVLALAAAAGLAAGVGACDEKTDAPGADTTASDSAAASDTAAADCCVGKNDCKGKGGCKTADHDCAGKNDCKGKGGCKHRECT